MYIIYIDRNLYELLFIKNNNDIYASPLVRCLYLSVCKLNGILSEYKKYDYSEGWKFVLELTVTLMQLCK